MAKKKLTKAQLAKVEAGIAKLRVELGYVEGRTEINLDQLKRAHAWIWSMFHYKSDSYTFNKDDFWDTEVFDRMLLSWLSGGDKVEDDCDGFGYAILELLYRVFNVNKAHLRRVACAAETGEGHFVAWVLVDGVWYQTENRTYDPKPVATFVKKGYTFWYYSDLNHIEGWYNATGEVENIVRDTPSSLAAEEPAVTLDNYTAVSKSRTLMKEWATKISGIALVVASQLPAWRSDLEHLLTPSVIGFLMIASGVIGIILRVKTTKPLAYK